MIALEPALAPRIERSFRDGAAHVSHERSQEMYFVQGKKMHAECLVRYEQVTDVGAGEAPARGTLAPRIERQWVRANFHVSHVEPALAGERGSRSSLARGRYAAELVDAAPRPRAWD